MLKFFNDTKVYVHCPAGVVTGGAELLHQFVSYLIKRGVDAYILYFSDNVSATEIPDDYKKYSIKIASDIDDSCHNVEVFYEGIFYKINCYKNTQKFLWWISVDNFFSTSQSYLNPFDLYKFNHDMGRTWIVKWLKRSIKKRSNLFRNLLSLDKLSKMDVVCGYQAEYIQHFLICNGFKEILPLKDYINTDHLVDEYNNSKDDIILYNPNKGFEYTRQLIQIRPDLKWIPLSGYKRSELIKLMQRAKVYIDFGFHPGKDRLPRECAMNGCCVITGYRGSAAFFEDVPIYNKYKFNEYEVDMNQIIQLIEWIFNNYYESYKDFEFYRRCIKREKDEFESQIDLIFNL